MNGGVSLAIWMSGVTREIDRLRQHDGPYGDLLDLLHATARVDVIAGASAGGLAGSLLGLAVATKSDVSSAADLWIERGGIKDMVRDPFEPDPPSLLRGDEHFLGQVRDALGTIATGAGNHPSAGGAPDAQDHDLHLIITTTTLSGEQTGYPDYFGTVIRDVDHRQAFHFRRTQAPARNDFGTDDESLSRLALAARTTSSFPGAFEPSLISVGAAGADDLHPDMKGIATFGHRRWAVDGGVLVNTPFRRALEAIKRLPAEREVRRVLVYIVASSGSTIAGRDDPDEMPTLRDVLLDTLSDLPRVQSFRDELGEIAEINRRAAERRRARRELLLRLGSEGLTATADRLMPAYVDARREAAVADVTRLVAEEAGSEAPLETPAPALDVRTVRAAVPVPQPGARGPGWKWGIAPVEYAANVVLDLLRAGMLDQETPRPPLQELRGRLHEQLRRLRALQASNERFWRSRATALTNGRGPTDADEWLDAHADEAGEIAYELGAIAAEAAAAIPGWRAEDDDVSDAAKLARALVPPDAGRPADAAVRVLLALHVVQRAAGSDLAGIEQTVELVQLSANVENSFDGRDRAAKKLAGLQLHHFGAFYKRSWRANDWLWGRLDGAMRLVQIVLDPRRLRTIAAERGLSARGAAEAIVGIATRGATDEERAYLLTRWDVGDLAKELEFLDDSTAEVPARLPRCWGAVATGIQWRILHDELGKPSGGRAHRRDRQVPADRGRGPVGGRASARPGALTDGDGRAVHEVRDRDRARRGRVRDGLLRGPGGAGGSRRRVCSAGTPIGAPRPGARSRELPARDPRDALPARPRRHVGKPHRDVRRGPRPGGRRCLPRARARRRRAGARHLDRDGARPRRG